MKKRKPEPPPAQPFGLDEVSTKDLLKSIRHDLREKGKSPDWPGRQVPKKPKKPA